MKKINKILNTFLSLILAIFISYFFVVFNSNLDNLKILDDDFVINIIGVLLALCVATTTLVYTSIDKLRQSIIKVNNLTFDQIDQIELEIYKVFKNIAKETMAILLFLTSTFLIILLKGTNIPFLTWPNLFFITKKECILLLKLFFVLITFYSVFEILMSLFKIIDSSYIISKKKDKNEEQK